jgi:glycosyltransferase involved in cell wall biosynthesis
MAHASISVIMPALNEEPNLIGSVAAVTEAFDGFCDYEIIIFNDGSSDRTGQIADNLAVKDARIRVVHNPINLGIGSCYQKGVDLARYDYALMVPGDDETPAATIRTIGEHAGKAEIVVTHTLNGHVRPVHRRILSPLFTLMMNALFGLRLRYYNGNCLIRTKILRGVLIDTSGFFYMAAALVRLLRQGHTYVETGIILQRRQSGDSKALRPKNVASVLKSVLALVWEIRFCSRRQARSVPVASAQGDSTPRAHADE